MKKSSLKQQKIYSSLVVTDENAFEMIYDPLRYVTAFVSLIENQVKIVEFIEYQDQKIFPYPPSANLLKDNVVFFPSEAMEYGSEQELLKDIEKFIHTYLEISPFFTKITPFYVLFTWIFDHFKELPYLRAKADYGSGKSRFIKTIGSICYKPMFTMGATTVAPIFRIIDQFRGTLILDEADLRFSDTNNEIVKILNNGFQDGIPVLRCGDSKQGYDVESYNVFGPKIVATRNKFNDQALESRFLVENMDGKLTRSDIPINLDATFEQQALLIRNKCLLWRLRNYGKIKIDTTTYNPSIEPRLNQIIMPLSSIVSDPDVRTELGEFILAYNRELIADRGLSLEATLLEVIISLHEGTIEPITLKQIAQSFNQKLALGEKEITERKVGSLVKSKFSFETFRRNSGNIVLRHSYDRNIARLRAKYGIAGEQVNNVNVVEDRKTDFQKELEGMNLKF